MLKGTKEKKKPCQQQEPEATVNGRLTLNGYYSLQRVT